MTAAELAEYLAQGCVFLPASGDYYGGSNIWCSGDDEGGYWSSTSEELGSAMNVYLYPGGFMWMGTEQSDYYISSRLVRE